MSINRSKTIVALTLALVPLMTRAAVSTNSGYTQLNLVANVASNAMRGDPQLLNPWGIVVGRSAIWVNDNHSSLSTTYDALGKKLKLTVNVPAPGGGGGAPTGLAQNDSAQFVINGSKAAPAAFLMATENGTIAAWNVFSGSNAVIVVDHSASNAIYKGIALARDATGAPHIYAANFHSQRVEEFDGQFNPVRSFTDPDVPDDFAPFNIRAIRGRLFVTYAKKDNPDAGDDEPGAGNGFIDIFDTDGTLLRRFAEHGALNSPWGLAVAPKNFGKFSHALLVGNFGDGTINAYDLLTGKWLGQLTTPAGNPVVIEGLWALSFEKDEILDHESEFIAQRLYFTAGPNEEADGLLGILRPVSPAFPPAR